jgi:hypothetical protein
MTINFNGRRLNDFNTPIKIYRGCMGSGKTYSTLKELSPEAQTLFVTERLGLADDAVGIAPHLCVPKAQPTKGKHLFELLKSGKSCVITHELFRMLDSLAITLIRELRVNCIIDELLDSTVQLRGLPSEGNLGTEANPYIDSSIRLLLNTLDVLEIDKNTNQVTWDSFKLPKPKNAGILTDLYSWANNGCLFWYNQDSESERHELSGYVVTTLPVNILTAFESVSILCYGFEGLPLEGYMKLFGIPYEFDDRFLKSEDGDLHKLLGKIEIVEDCNVYDYLDKEAEKLNQKKGFSMSKFCWDKLITGAIAKGLGSRLETYMKSNGFKQKDALWTTYKGHRDSVGKGFSRKVLNTVGNDNIKDFRKGKIKTFASWTLKGTNEYKDRSLMMHLCCPHMNENLRRFFLLRGIRLDNDAYTLEMTRQWIMRGVARNRDSDEVMTCLILSKKARTLLSDWLNNRTVIKKAA